MSAMPIDYLDAMPVEHLDFTPTCTLKNQGVPCGKEASWWMLGGPHTCEPDDRTHDYFLCEGHHAYVVIGGRCTCVQCRARLRVIEYVLQLVPL